MHIFVFANCEFFAYIAGFMQSALSVLFIKNISAQLIWNEEAIFLSKHILMRYTLKINHLEPCIKT